jgi:hypothetical protein
MGWPAEHALFPAVNPLWRNHFPASKQQLIEHAQKQKADDVVMNELKNLPDQQYTNMADVMKGFGQTH